MSEIAMNQEMPAAPIKRANGHTHFTTEITVAQFRGRAESCKTPADAAALIMDTLASLGYSGPLADLWMRFPELLPKR